MPDEIESAEAAVNHIDWDMLRLMLDDDDRAKLLRYLRERDAAIAARARAEALEEVVTLCRKRADEALEDGEAAEHFALLSIAEQIKDIRALAKKAGT